MASDNEIVLEIVLDDGSVQKGFAKIKSAAQDTSKEASKSTGNFVDDFSDQLGGIASKFAPIGVAAAAAGFAIKKAFDLTVAGEQIERINTSFNFLAQSAGLSGSQLAQSLEGAANGLVDTEELLQSANAGVVALGQNAQNLPQIFEAARRVTTVFGGELLQNFEELNRAIATGNVRALRNFGVIVDVDRAQAAYAKTIGTTAANLSDFEKQSVNLDLVLGKIQQRFGDIPLSLNQTRDGFARLSVAIGEIGDTLALRFSGAFSSLFSSLFNSTANAINNFNQLLRSSDSEQGKVTLRLQALAEETQKLNEAAKAISEGDTILSGKAFVQGKGFLGLDIIQSRLEIINKETDKLDKKLISLNRNNVQDVAAPAQSPDELAAIERRNQERLAKETAFNQQLSTVKATARQAELQAQLVSASEEDAFRLNQQIKIEQEKAAFDAKILALDQQFFIARSLTESQYNQLREQEAARLAASITAITTQSQTQQLGSFLAFSKQTQEVTFSLGKFLASTLTQAFQNVGAALAKGENAFDAFTKTIIGSLGDLAIQTGGLLIAAGIGVDNLRVSLSTFQGAGAIAAGAALVALGGAMKALSGGLGGVGGTGNAPSTVSPGVADSPSSPAVTQDSTGVQERQTAVVVNVQGNILNNRDSALYIADILNEQFRTGGAVLATAGV